ncbi:response regulator [Pseudomaricurvus alkylphenolicus]|uniref:response regulator n=1 Tax=Pseudomaricurvus alkylphenolicus TaxID=1306991 RepID=UPI001422F5DC|nr:response regulator [Pseudomaricurvus alkylphenolicus]
MRILIVDDSRAMQSIVRRGLEKAGYTDLQTRTAGSAVEALDIARHWEPDLILSDWHMPEMSGLELLKALNREMLGIKVGFVTTETSAARIQEAREAGAKFVVNKPFDMETLHSAVLPVLNSSDDQISSYREGLDIIEAEADAGTVSAVVPPSGAETKSTDEPKELNERVILPLVSEVEYALNKVASAELLMEPIEPLRFGEQQFPCVLGLLSDSDDGKVRAVCILDLKAACVLGGALGALREDIVHQGIADREVSSTLLEDCERLLKVITDTINGKKGNEHRQLQLNRASLVHQSFARLESLLETPADERLDAELAVIGYGQGTLTIVAS